MAQVWELDLPQGEKFVLLAFADHADDEGVCRPSVERVAWKTGYEQRQVKRIGKKLRESGLLLLLRQARPERGLAAEYRIQAHKGIRLAPFRGAVGDKMSSASCETGDIARQSRGHLKHSAGDIAVSPQPSVGTTKSQPSKSEAPAGALFSEPQLVPVGTWLAYAEMRRKNRKPLTDHASELIRRKLEDLKAQGHDPIEVLEQSIRNGWQDVFPIRGDLSIHKSNGKGGTIDADERTRRNLAVAGL